MGVPLCCRSSVAGLVLLCAPLCVGRTDYIEPNWVDFSGFFAGRAGREEGGIIIFQVVLIIIISHMSSNQALYCYGLCFLGVFPLRNF